MYMYNTAYKKKNGLTTTQYKKEGIWLKLSSAKALSLGALASHVPGSGTPVPILASSLFHAGALEPSLCLWTNW